MIHTIILVRTPYQLLDPVPLANIRYQIQQGRISLGGNGVGVGGVGSNFNGDCPVVIGAVAGTPRTILFINGKANGTILPHNIVGGTLPVCGGEIITPLFCCPLPNDTMDRDGVNGMVPGTGLVFRDPGIGCKPANKKSSPQSRLDREKFAGSRRRKKCNTKRPPPMRRPERPDCRQLLRVTQPR